MNLANPKRILLIYLICLSPDIFVHFYNTLLNLLIYSLNMLFYLSFTIILLLSDTMLRKPVLRVC